MKNRECNIKLQRKVHMNEAEFLQQYNQKAFDTPNVSVDSVLFTYHEQQLKVLMVNRANYPDKGLWGLPGGFVNLQKDKTLEDTALRKLAKKTGVKPPYLEQIYTVGNDHRDKRAWSITVCYSALIAHQYCKVQVNSVNDAKWLTLDEVSNITLAFDHQQLIDAAHQRLKQKALYSIVPAFVLPEQFTLPELQHVHEVIIGKSLQKKSFRRRIEQAELLIDTGEKRGEGGRPATLYKLKSNAGQHTFIRNLEN